MYINKDFNETLNTSQIAYPVGQEKDSYSIQSWYKEDLNTGKVTVRHTLIKNVHLDSAEVMMESSYKECVAAVVAIVREQGEWIKEKDSFNTILTFDHV